MADKKQSQSHMETHVDPWEVVARFAPYLRIAHHIAGRVRLKLVAAALDAPHLHALDGNCLKAAFAGVQGVRDIRINLLARSCTVDYDTATIPDAAWPDLLAGRRSPAAATMLELIAAASPRTPCRKEKTP